MHLSIVTTLYYSAPYLLDFYTRICAEAEKITSNYEIIFVNDGSPDNSLDIVLSFYKKDTKVKIIDLSRNFGHHKAIMTGLAHAQGELVFLLDCDLEEEPELLGAFYECINSSKADTVYGVQHLRKGNFFERATGSLFYKLFNLLSNYPVPHSLITARLMSRRYVSALVEHRDREIFLAGLWAITGFKQVPLVVKKHSKGTSTYTLRRRVSIFVNSITSFSNKPLVFIFYLGTSILLLSSVAAADLILRRLFWGALLEGWASLIVSIWLIGGITIFCLGIIGIYLSKVFTETKQRPYTVIREIYEHSNSSAPKTVDITRVFDNAKDCYSQKLVDHEAIEKGADWNTPELQTLRFEQLLKICETSQLFSINDYGCGYGELVEYLTSKGHQFSYAGFDASDHLILRAKELHSSLRNCHFFNDEFRLSIADYTVANGIFSIKLQASNSEWEVYLLETLNKFFRLSRKGFAFNGLTKYSNPEQMHPDRYYADPCWLFDYCKRYLSRNVTLFHDYNLDEFTIAVKKKF